jgi:hypothetical protein
LLQIAKSNDNDLAYISLADRRIHPLLATEFDERSPKFSPDGRWIAYSSNESGSYEVFVRPLLTGDQKFQISTQGGARELWSRHSHELFYIAFDGDLMAVPANTSPTFSWEAPRRLFRTPIDTASLFSSYPYAVSPDGQRFIIVTPTPDAATSISVIINWPAALKK